MFELQKKIGLLFFIAGTIVFIANLLYLGSNSGFAAALTDESVYILGPLAVCSLISAFINKRMIRFFQFALLCLAATVAILDAYDSFYGLGLLLLAIILAFKYEYFEKRALLKLSLIGIYSFGLIEISVALNENAGRIIVGFDAISFLTLIVIFIYILYRSEIRDYLQRQIKYSSDISRLRSERDRLKRRLQEDKEKLARLDEKITMMEEEQKPLDLEKFGISPAEEKIIRILCLYRCENREIANRLHISVSTVKTHLHHIMDKLGVDDRYAVLDMCRNNFREKKISVDLQ